MITQHDLEAAYAKGRELLGEPILEARPKTKAEEYKVKGGYLSMSDALKCDRLSAYKYFGVQPSDERTLNGDAEAGIFLEGKIIEALEMGGIPVTERGTRCKTNIHGIPVSGKLDGAVNESRQLLEIKTLDEKGFDKNIKYNQPSPWNRPQIELYLRSKLRSFALFFYLCRDTGRHKAYEVQPDDQLWERIKSSIYRVATAQKPEETPKERIPLCKWCVYRTACWGVEDEMEVP